jgi:hypothetical protein
LITDGGIELEDEEKGIGWPKSVIETIKLCQLVDTTGFLPLAGGLFDQDAFFVECYQTYLQVKSQALAGKVLEG